MLIYELYKSFIKNGDDELFDYFAFIYFSLLVLIPDIITSPILLIAFIIRKVRRLKQWMKKKQKK